MSNDERIYVNGGDGQMQGIKQDDSRRWIREIHLK